MAQFKLALNAGHDLKTPGKRLPEALDPAQTREWTLNDRVADKVERLLKEGYTGCTVLRTDDTTGQTDVPLRERTDAANAFRADLYLSIHHNAGIHGGSGGGIIAIVYDFASEEAKVWQKELYDALIQATGLRGNRASPLTQMNLHELRETAMPAVLLELGFMDSTADAPVILTEAFAEQCAGAIVEVIARRAGLVKKSQDLYRVQVGAYTDRANAVQQLEKLRQLGFTDAFIHQDRG